MHIFPQMQKKTARFLGVHVNETSAYTGCSLTYTRWSTTHSITENASPGVTIWRNYSIYKGGYWQATGQET